MKYDIIEIILYKTFQIKMKGIVLKQFRQSNWNKAENKRMKYNI